MISDQIGLNSVLLPFHLSVTHIRKSDESERRLTEFDGTVSDKIAGSTNCHLKTQFFVCLSINTCLRLI